MNVVFVFLIYLTLEGGINLKEKKRIILVLKKLHLKEEMNVGYAFPLFPKIKKMLTVLFTKSNKTRRYQQLVSLQENVFSLLP